jgi:hypothetical protein
LIETEEILGASSQKESPMSDSFPRRRSRRVFRRFVTITLALLPAVASASPAAAGAICVEDGDGFAWVFPQVKLPAKAGKAKALHGYTRSAFGQIGTATGTAVRLTGGDYEIGVTVLRWGIDSVVGATYIGSVDGDFAGTLLRENTFPPQTLTLDEIDCDEVPTP